MTDLLCVVCPVFGRDGEGSHPKPRQPRAPNVCDTDRERLVNDLVGIPAAYLALVLHLMPSRGNGERFGKGFESTPPVNVSALSLLGPGEDTPLERLFTWAADWSGYLHQKQPDHDMGKVCGWLGSRLDWACADHPAIDEFALDVRDIAGHLRAFGGRDRGESVGRCPRRIGEQACNTPLFVDPYVDVIECSRCHMTWKRRQGEWMHLRAQQTAAGVEAAA